MSAKAGKAASRGGAGITIALALAIACFAAPSAAARGLVVVPRPASPTGLSYLRVTARPGRSAMAGAVQLVNRGIRPIRVALALVDGLTLDTLGSSYRAPSARTSAATRWVRMRGGALTLGAHATVSVPVTVAVPRSAQPGDYLSGVSVEALGQQPVQAARSGVATTSAVRYVVGVETSIVGPRVPTIVFTGARLRQDPAGAVFLLDATNAGNVILTGVLGRVEVTQGRRVVLSRPIPPGTFVAHSAIAYPVPALAERPAAGTVYVVSAWLRYGRRVARLHQTISFGRLQATLQHRYTPMPKLRHAGSSLPWWAFAIAGYALLITGLVLRLLLLRRRARGQQQQAGPPPRVLAGG